MDAFTQYLEDELNQAQATIARLQDELNHRTASTSPTQDQISDSSSRMTRVPSGVSADIADELHRLQSSSLQTPLKLEDLDGEA